MDILVPTLTERFPKLSLNSNVQPHERSIIEGYNYCQKLWRAGDEVVLAINMLRHYVQIPRLSLPSSTDHARINELYITFITILDAAPPWLQLSTSSERHSTVTDDQNDLHPALQRCNLRITFHFLHMIIQQRLEDLEAQIQITAQTTLPPAPALTSTICSSSVLQKKE